VVQIHSPRPILSMSYLGLLCFVYTTVDKIVDRQSLRGFPVLVLCDLTKLTCVAAKLHRTRGGSRLRRKKHLAMACAHRN